MARTTPVVARTLGDLVIAEGELGNAARQKELLERTLKIFEDFFGQDHLDVAKTLCNLGIAELSLHQFMSGKEEP